jgi:hypothetical protein
MAPFSSATISRRRAHRSKMVAHRMMVSSTAEAAALVRERGGRLFVWPDRLRCCQGATYLLTASDPPPGRVFRPVEGSHGFELWFDPGGLQPPDELQLDIGGWRTKRIEAYWNGCVFVV